MISFFERSARETVKHFTGSAMHFKAVADTLYRIPQLDGFFLLLISGNAVIEHLQERSLDLSYKGLNLW